jgi:hypothetical protein
LNHLLVLFDCRMNQMGFHAVLERNSVGGWDGMRDQSNSDWNFANHVVAVVVAAAVAEIAVEVVADAAVVEAVAAVAVAVAGWDWGWSDSVGTACGFAAMDFRRLIALLPQRAARSKATLQVPPRQLHKSRADLIFRVKSLPQPLLVDQIILTTKRRTMCGHLLSYSRSESIN